VTDTFIIGDWKNVVCDKSYRNIVGPHGLKRRNQRGQIIVDFRERNAFDVTSKRFKKPNRRLYSWKTPGDRNRYYLEHIHVKT
jgi:hypothetical protein